MGSLQSQHRPPTLVLFNPTPKDNVFSCANLKTEPLSLYSFQSLPTVEGQGLFHNMS